MTRNPRIFVPGKVVGKTHIQLTDENLHHLRDVLHLSRGDLFRATDGEGTEYLVRLTADEEGWLGSIEERSCPLRESPLHIILAQAVPKGDLMGKILPMAVELGVSEIWPLTTSRTSRAKEVQRIEKRHERWRRIAEGAVAQTGRNRVPQIRNILTWKRFLDSEWEADLKILLWEKEGRGLKETLSPQHDPQSVVVAIGPEGGWGEEEVGRFRRKGFRTAGMGPRILRTGTAALAAVGIVQFLYGDLGKGGQPRKG